MQVRERPWPTTEIKNPLKVLYNPICTFDFYETQFILFHDILSKPLSSLQTVHLIMKYIYYIALNEMTFSY